MPDSVFQNMLQGDARGRWVRLRTLTLLRWLAITGQAGAVAAAIFVFGLQLPVELCIFAIAASVVFNIISMQFYPANARLNEKSSLISMLFDLAQVSFLLFITGGLTNPFAALLLAPVVMSASVLILRSALVVGACALVSVSLMGLWRMPLMFANGDVLAPPPIYIFGVWASLTIAIIFMAV
ncbi:MAG: sensor histidine kinase, partial [Alphaproteobacteria bacterium]|nr:sensor histidine kinase [Alphaproteobacteria bacterium]